MRPGNNIGVSRMVLISMLALWPRWVVVAMMGIAPRLVRCSVGMAEVPALLPIDQEVVVITEGITKDEWRTVRRDGVQANHDGQRKDQQKLE